MNALATRGEPVSVYETFGEAAAATAVLVAGISFHPKVRARLDRRRQRREDLDGVPDRVEIVAGQPVVVEKGRPSLAASVQSLVATVGQINERTDLINESTQQLTRNGGGTVADAVHRMEEKLDEEHAENQRAIADLRATAESNAEDLREVKLVAGQAATAASSADQRTRELAGEFEVFRNVVLHDAADIWTALSDLGHDRREGGEG